MRWTDIMEDGVEPGIKAQMDEEFEAVWAKIEVECSQAITAMRKAQRGMWRGVRTEAPDIFVGRPRADRIPKTSSVVEHEFTNKGFALLGFETNRSNSIAVIGNEEGAHYYGFEYLIFPKNGFKFLYGNRHDLISLVNNGILPEWLKENYPEQHAELIDFTNHMIRLHRSRDVSYDVKQFYFNFMEDRPELMKAYWLSRKEKFKLTNRNIQTALKKGFEIMVSHCEYYAIIIKYRKQIQEKLGFRLI